MLQIWFSNTFVHGQQECRFHDRDPTTAGRCLCVNFPAGTTFPVIFTALPLQLGVPLLHPRPAPHISVAHSAASNDGWCQRALRAPLRYTQHSPHTRLGLLPRSSCRYLKTWGILGMQREGGGRDLRAGTARTARTREAVTRWRRPRCAGR